MAEQLPGFAPAGQKENPEPFPHTSQCVLNQWKSPPPNSQNVSDDPAGGALQSEGAGPPTTHYQREQSKIMEGKWRLAILHFH
jgi:hypothetical protein